MKRTYYKLNKTLIERLLKELEVFSKLRLIRKGAIRSVCKKVGISHTTFYRWLREYRLLVAKGKQRHRGKEKTLVDFGRAIERLFSEARSVGEVDPSLSDLFAIQEILQSEFDDLLKERFVSSEGMQTCTADDLEVLASYMNISGAYQDSVHNYLFKQLKFGFCGGTMDVRGKKSNQDDTDWEALTDQVTGGIGFVEFEDKTSRKDV